VPLINPAKQLYHSMDIENLSPPSKREESKGLLAPTKSPMSDEQDNRTKQPAFKVGHHMLLLRKERERLQDV
tara:strand:+ start:201 stop:416 length:216 start_codon:yes stop_codon:yes gene_type:complete